MSVDPDDYVENKEKLEESEYIRYKKMLSTVFYELKNLEQRMVDMQVAFDDAQRANAAGVQNVYNKFLAIEHRQIEIEELLQSDRVRAMIESIPNEDSILRMFDMIDNHPITDIKESITRVREDLQEMVDRFTF